MTLSEFCIRRPVFTVLLMLALLVGGLFGYKQLAISALPNVDFPTIQVNVNLPGADPETMAATVATPLEREFSTISGIDSIVSTSFLGSTQITLQFNMSRDLDGAALDVQTSITAASSKLPKELPAPPRLQKVNPADQPVIYIVVSSDTLPMTDVNEYADTIMAQRLASLLGVSQVNIFGAQKRAIRIRVNPVALAGRNLSLDDVASSIAKAASITPMGVVDGKSQTFTIDVLGQPDVGEKFNRVIISSNQNSVVRISDIGEAVEGVENERTAGFVREGRGVEKKAILLAIQRQPNSNVVEVVNSVRSLLPQFKEIVPPGIDITPLFDRSVSIRESIRDIELTLGLTVLLVILVIYAFLRNARATMIPALAVPFSLIATFGGMSVLGFSLNNISLLALTLSVGYVVDDAIVMVENIVRYIEKGMDPLKASLVGSREIGFTIISITFSLIAVFIPVLFMGGVVGRLFREFAVTISMAILISGLVSLTLTPMVCRYILKAEKKASGSQNNVLQLFEFVYTKTHDFYGRTLSKVIEFRFLTLMVAVATFFVTILFYVYIPKGFFPIEDTGVIFAQSEAAQDISVLEMLDKQHQIAKIVEEHPSVDTVYYRVGGGAGAINAGRLVVGLKPLRDRKNIESVLNELREKTRQIEGINVYWQPVQNLTVGGRLSKALYQYTLQGSDFKELSYWSNEVYERLIKSPGVVDLSSDLQLKSLKLAVDINKDKAEYLGITYEQIRRTLYYGFGDAQISTLYTPSNSYEIILKVEDVLKSNIDALKDLFIRTKSGKLIELDAVAKISLQEAPLLINHQGQLPSVTLSFNLLTGASLGSVIEDIKKIEQDIVLPKSIISSYQGNAQVFQSSMAGMGVLILVSVLTMYIILGMLYESFIHPITILSGLPSAGIGALLALSLAGMNLDIIAIIGIILLIGIVKKNGIMMVDFAISARQGGASPEKSIYDACLIRFRPIMMTTMAALLGVIPIAIGIGAGAELRQPLGVAVLGGLLLSQVLTLYLTPVVYLYLEEWKTRERD